MSKDANYRRLIQAKRWKELRKKKITADPLCENCLIDGIIETATEVHHIEPAENAINIIEMEHLMYDYNNLRSLCHSCHQLEHVKLKSKSKAYIKANAERRTERFLKKFF